MPSLDVLEDVVRREYDAQERRSDSLDTKAGLVLGFAGVLVSLTPASVWPPFTLLARGLAAAAGVLALRAFALAPRVIADLGNVRVTELTEARYGLVTSMIAAHGDIQEAATRKSRRIRAALLLLALALGTIVAGTAAGAVGRW